MNVIAAQIITVRQNGIAEAKGIARDKLDHEFVYDVNDLRKMIWTELQKIGRKGHVLVKWNDQMFLCEMKQSGKGYIRMKIDYHPAAECFLKNVDNTPSV